MQMNPAIKPKVATPALVILSAVTLVLAVVLLAMTNEVPGSGWFLVAVIVLVLVILSFWAQRIRGQRSWQATADARWKQLESFKNNSGTTAEVTVLSVDALQPTGSWISIRWNRFDYIQPAWIEALPEPIWSGSVLLIRPDPAQIRPGSPWPADYFIDSDHVLGWAPLVS